jgi:hypothetical protein
VSSLPRSLWPVVGKPKTRWPGWRFDLPIVAHYAPALAAAHLAAYPNLEQVVRRLLGRHPLPVAKAKPDGRDPNQIAMRAELAQMIHLDADAILAALRDIYGDSYLAGARAALTALEEAGLEGAVTVSGFGGLMSSIGWDGWTPGYAEAANEIAGVNGGIGLANLLTNSGVRIAGITGTDLDRIAAVLAEGIRAGQSVDAITADVMAMIGDAGRAEMIAWTETSRAMSVAALNTYTRNGIGGWNWLISPGACPECESEALGNPHGMNDDPPPGHRRTRRRHR